MGTLVVILVALLYAIGAIGSMKYIRKFYEKHQVHCPSVILWYSGLFWPIWLLQAFAFDFRTKRLNKKE